MIATPKFRFVSEADKVLRRWNRKKLSVLKRTGLYGRKVMHNLLKKKRPKQFTPKGRISKRYQKEIEGGGSRPPYMVTGRLAHSIRFEVVDNSSVIIGPTFGPGKKSTLPATTIPALLNDGGSATIRKRTRDNRLVVYQVTYRAFPFTAPVFEKALPRFKERLAQEAL